MENKIKRFINRMEHMEMLIHQSNDVMKSIINYQLMLENQLQELIKSNGSPTIAIKSASKIDFLPVDEILYCGASLNYTEIISINHNKIISSKSINEFEHFFDQYPFFRISKSYLVHTKHIHSYNKKSGQVLMKNKELLDVARRRKADFLRAIVPY